MAAASLPRRSFGPLLLRYGAAMAFDVFKYAFFVLLGAEAIFLSDVLISNLLPKVLDHQASFLSLILLIVFSIPGVIIIALPLAIMIGSYIVVMSRRQATEFAAIAGMGFGSRALINLFAIIGLGALAVSHVLSGYVEPLARYQLSNTLFQLENDALREGRIAPGEFYQIGDYAVFISGGQINGTAHKFFVHERVNPATERIIMADQSIRLREPQISGIGLLLQDVAVYEFENDGMTSAKSSSEQTCVGCTQDSEMLTLRIKASNKTFVQLREANLPVQKPRGGQTSEWTNLELLQRDQYDRETTATLGERLLRDLLCFFAPLIGLLAAAATTNKTYLFALPTAGGIVLGAQFLGSYGVKSIAGIGLFGTIAGLSVLAAVTALAIAFAVLRRERGFISPLGAGV